MDLQNLKKMIDEGYISVRKHPVEDLWIYNYTAKTQYDQVWNNETLMCRGLILNSDMDIIARPFKKFFNLSEHKGTLPEGEPDIWEKYDGSLGIMYWVNNEPYIATRGSFVSDQAEHANKLLRTPTYALAASKLSRSQTHLFEIIYPENRIVVDYGRDDLLVHLGSIDTKTGKFIEPDSDFCLAMKWHNIKFPNLPNRTDAEGYVLVWPNGFRLKIKHDEYVRLHRLLTQVTARSIWDLLRNKEPIDELLDRVPDEFYTWVKSKVKEFKDKYFKIFAESRTAYYDIIELSTRKEQAIEINKYHKKYAKIIFALLDSKPIDSIIWNMLRPEHETPFMNNKVNNEKNNNS